MGSVAVQGKNIIINIDNDMMLQPQKQSGEQKELLKETPELFMQCSNAFGNPHVFDGKTTKMQKADWVWPEGKINYVIGQSLTKDMINKLKHAFMHFQDNTPIKFYQIVQPHNLSEYVKFHRSMKNTSYTLWCGRKKNGGEHGVYLLDTQPIGTYIHEIMHILGFEHEQCRQDRDEKLIVNQNNLIGDNNKHQYKKKGYMLGEHDLDSIMHYRLTKNIMEQNGIQNSNNIGQRKQLSQGDIKGIKYVYGDFSCTYDVFPEEYYAQPFYECIDCWGKDSCYGACEVCAYTCHEGHELIFHDINPQKVIKFVCDCGRYQHQQGLCTRKSTQLKYVKQHMYQCFDCFPTLRSEKGGLLGICANCMKKCHYCHNIKYYGLSSSFYCDCGLQDCKQICKAQGQ